jgi:acetyl-CoA carboxylase biotin carboxyl carrier protein
MTPDDLHGYLALFHDSDWCQLTVTTGSDSLHVCRAEHTTEVSATAVPPPPDRPSVPDIPAPTVVRSPSVGVLRLTRQATAAPAPGEQVIAGSWLADIIVADRIEPVLSPADGTVAARLGDDSDPVEYNQPLIVIQSWPPPAQP